MAWTPSDVGTGAGASQALGSETRPGLVRAVGVPTAGSLAAVETSPVLICPGIPRTTSTLPGLGSAAGSRPHQAHAAGSLTPFCWSVHMGPSVFLEGPVFLTAAFPVPDTQRAPGRQEQIHGCQEAPGRASRAGCRLAALERGLGRCRPGMQAEGQSAGQGSVGPPPALCLPSPQRKGEVNKPITLGNEAK